MGKVAAIALGSCAGAPNPVLPETTQQESLFDASAPVAADATAPKLDWYPRTLDFGQAPCGGEAPRPQTFTIANDGLLRVDYTIAIRQSSRFAVASTHDGALGARAVQSFAIGALPIEPQSEPRASERGELAVEFDDSVHRGTIVVPIVVTARGAKVEAHPESLDFGTVARGSSKTLAVTLQNTGTEEVSVVPEPSNVLSMLSQGSAASFLLPVGTSREVLITWSPVAAGAAPAEAALSLGGIICGTRRVVVRVSGSGT